MSCDTALTQFRTTFATQGGPLVNVLGGPDVAANVLNRVAHQARLQPWLQHLPPATALTSTTEALRTYQALLTDGQQQQAQALFGTLKLFKRMQRMGIDPFPHPPAMIPRRPAAWFGYAAIEETLACLELGGGLTELPTATQAIIAHLTELSQHQSQPPAMRGRRLPQSSMARRTRDTLLATKIMASDASMLPDHIACIDAEPDSADSQFLLGCAVLRYAQIGKIAEAQMLVRERLGNDALRAELQARLPRMDAAMLPTAYALCRAIPGQDTFTLLQTISDRHRQLTEQIVTPAMMVDATSFSAWLNDQPLLKLLTAPCEWQVDPGAVSGGVPTQLAVWCEHVQDATYMDGIVGYLFRGRMGLRGEFHLSLRSGAKDSSGRLFIFSFNLTKSPSDDPVAHLYEIAEVVTAGTPVRTTDRSGLGTRGTRAYEPLLGQFFLAWR